VTDFGALFVDGGLLEAANNPAYAFGVGDFSVETLVQTTLPGPLISKYLLNNPVKNGGFILAIAADGAIALTTSDGHADFVAATSPTSVLDGDWHHVAGVRQSGGLAIYLDGSLQPSTTSGSGSPTPDVSTVQPLTLGGPDPTTSSAAVFAGIVDDVAMWSRALTASEIVDGMFERIPPSAPGLVAYWTLENTFTDSSPTANPLSSQGEVDFVPVNHWASLDFGANLSGSGVIRAPSNPAYDVGQGDFSVGGFVQTTQPGTLIARKGSAGGTGNGGLLLVLEPNGVIKLATDDGISFFQAQTAASDVLDGSWHHVVGIRSGGSLSVLIDGQALAVTTSGPGASPLNVTNSDDLVLGGTDQSQEPFNQLNGWLEDLCYWNVAVSPAVVDAWRFGLLTGSESGLVGYFTLDGNGDDLSPTHNNAACDASVTFGVIYTALATSGANSYTYCAITSDPPPAVTLARGLTADGSACHRQQCFVVQAGAPVLVAALNAPSDEVMSPVGVTLTVTDPTGKVYNSPEDSDALYVGLGDTGSIAQLVVVSPVTGTWTVAIDGPSDARFQCQVTTIPTADVAATIEGALAPMYPEGNPNALTLGPRGLLLAGSSWSCWWCFLGAWALAIIVLAVILVIAGVATGGVGFVAALGAVAAFLGTTVAAGAFILAIGTWALASIATLLCVAIGQCGGSGTPAIQTVVNNIRNKVGVPARSGAQATRADAGIDASYPITLDVGGEGPKPWDGSGSFHGLVTGFPSAINLNDKIQTTGGPPTRDIPLLVQVASWGTNPGYPLAAGFANYVTMQGCPLTDTNVAQMASVVAPGGKIGLWIDQGAHQSQINALAASLKTTPQYNAPDEFNGNAGFPKTLLVNKR